MGFRLEIEYEDDEETEEEIEVECDTPKIPSYIEIIFIINNGLIYYLIYQSIKFVIF